MGRRITTIRRTDLQVSADAAADVLSRRMGRMLADSRTRTRATQRQASACAGISQAEWSALERGTNATIATWSRAASAVGANLDAYLRGSSAADQPRDAVHLRNQELLMRTAAPGAWRALPEQLIDREARTSRAADVLLFRQATRPMPDEYAIAEVWDWFADVGAAGRDWQRRLAALERYAIARMRDEVLPRHSGVWVIRATARNRRLVGDHTSFFKSLLPGTGHAWLSALGDSATAMPTEPALIWVSVAGDRLWPARLG
jgi:hypothetical protein